MANLENIKPLPPESTGSNVEEDRIFKRVFLSPAVIVLLLLAIFPLIWSLGVSFTDLQRNAASQAVANQQGGAAAPTGFLNLGFNFTFANYARIPTDDRLIGTAKNTLFYVVVGVALQYSLGLGLATLLNQPFRGRTLVRAIFLLPMMMTPVAAGYTGRMMFDPSLSPLAQLLRTIGKLIGTQGTLTVPWLTSTDWAPLTIVLIDTWQWTPFMILLLLAGMQAIPDEVYEAARVDGANRWQVFRSITFPILLPITLTAVLIRGLEIFKIVDIIRVTTGGGPGTSTESLVMYVFQTVFEFGNYSYAAAISYVLLVMVIVFSTGFLALSRFVTIRNLGE